MFRTFELAVMYCSYSSAQVLSVSSINSLPSRSGVISKISCLQQSFDLCLSALPSSLRLTFLSDQHPYPFSKRISTLGVFALGALLSGLYYEMRFINLEIRYDTTRNNILWTYVGPLDESSGPNRPGTNWR